MPITNTWVSHATK